MDSILGKLEKLIEGQLEQLESNPIKTSLKLLLWYWILKTIWKEVKR